MRECEALQVDLKAYLDGELSAFRRLSMRRHIARCATCREEVTAMERIGRELRVDADTPLNPALRARILDALPDRPPAPVTPPSWRRSSLALWSAAASLALVGVIIVQWFRHAGEMPVYQTGAADSYRSAPVRRAPALAEKEERRADNEAALAKRVAEAPAAPAASTPPPASSGGPAFGGPSAMPEASSEPQRIARSMQPPTDSTLRYENVPTTIQPSLAGEKKQAASSETTKPGVTDGDAGVFPIEGRKEPLELALVVEGIEKQSRAAMELARSAGARLVTRSSETGDDGVKTSSITLQVPAAQVGPLVDRLHSLGERNDMNKGMERAALGAPTHSDAQSKNTANRNRLNQNLVNQRKNRGQANQAPFVTLTLILREKPAW